jgi:hypothetical protein
VGSELQKSLPAEADGAVHITPAAKAAAAAPTVAINTLVFMLSNDQNLWMALGLVT